MECGSAQLGEVEEVLAESNSKEKGEGNGTDYRFACERRDLAHIYCAMLLASPPSFTPQMLSFSCTYINNDGERQSGEGQATG